MTAPIHDFEDDKQPNDEAVAEVLWGVKFTAVTGEQYIFSLDQEILSELQDMYFQETMPEEYDRHIAGEHSERVQELKDDTYTFLITVTEYLIQNEACLPVTHYRSQKSVWFNLKQTVHYEAFSKTPDNHIETMDGDGNVRLYDLVPQRPR